MARVRSPRSSRGLKDFAVCLFDGRLELSTENANVGSTSEASSSTTRPRPGPMSLEELFMWPQQFLEDAGVIVVKALQQVSETARQLQNKR